MKKTLIVLVALSGLAMATEPTTIDGKKFNMDLQFRLAEDPYVAGSEFTLSFTITQAENFDKQQEVITLGTGDKAFKVWAQSGTYIGLTTTDNPNGWHNGEWSRTEGINYITLDGPSNCWISKNVTAEDVNTNAANAQPGYNNSQWTFTSNGTDTTIELIAGNGNSSCHEVITINNFAMDLNQFAVLNAAGDEAGVARLAGMKDAVVTYNGKTHDLMTPEPATATLSLLALAGLCARRRRH